MPHLSWVHITGRSQLSNDSGGEERQQREAGGGGRRQEETGRRGGIITKVTCLGFGGYDERGLTLLSEANNALIVETISDKWMSMRYISCIY